jgi:hypothetical protein
MQIFPIRKGLTIVLEMLALPSSCGAAPFAIDSRCSAEWREPGRGGVATRNTAVTPLPWAVEGWGATDG